MNKLKLLIAFLAISGSVVGGVVGNSYLGLDNSTTSRGSKEDGTTRGPNSNLQPTISENTEITTEKIRELIIKNYELQDALKQLSNPAFAPITKPTINIDSELQNLSEDLDTEFKTWTDKNQEIMQKIKDLNEEKQKLIQARKEYYPRFRRWFNKVKNAGDNMGWEIVFSSELSVEKMEEADFDAFFGNDLVNLDSLFTYQRLPLVPKRTIKDIVWTENGGLSETIEYHTAHLVEQTHIGKELINKANKQYHFSAVKFKNSHYIKGDKKCEFIIKHLSEQEFASKSDFSKTFGDASKLIQNHLDNISKMTNNDDWKKLDY